MSCPIGYGSPMLKKAGGADAASTTAPQGDCPISDATKEAWKQQQKQEIRAENLMPAPNQLPVRCGDNSRCLARGMTASITAGARAAAQPVHAPCRVNDPTDGVHASPPGRGRQHVALPLRANVLQRHEAQGP